MEESTPDQRRPPWWQDLIRRAMKPPRWLYLIMRVAGAGFVAAIFRFLLDAWFDDGGPSGE